MSTMRMPWSKSGNLQLGLLDAPAAPEAATAAQAAPGASARSASMVPTASLYEGANNPRTEIPDAELDELAEDIRQHGILQPIVVHRADREGRHQIHSGAKRWRAAHRIGLLEWPVVVRDGVRFSEPLFLPHLRQAPASTPSTAAPPGSTARGPASEPPCGSCSTVT
jgi:hypothetical protein